MDKVIVNDLRSEVKSGNDIVNVSWLLIHFFRYMDNSVHLLECSPSRKEVIPGIEQKNSFYCTCTQIRVAFDPEPPEGDMC